MARCVRFKRVRSVFGGTVRRCAKFSGGRRRRRSSRRSYARRAKRRCVRFGRNRLGVRTCRKYAGTRGTYARRSARRGGYRRGRRPFNKGRKCTVWGVGKGGRRVCRSYKPMYGPVQAWRGWTPSARSRPRGGEVQVTVVDAPPRGSLLALPAFGSR